MFSFFFHSYGFYFENAFFYFQLIVQFLISELLNASMIDWFTFAEFVLKIVVKRMCVYFFVYCLDEDSCVNYDTSWSSTS